VNRLGCRICICDFLTYTFEGKTYVIVCCFNFSIVLIGYNTFNNMLSAQLNAYKKETGILSGYFKEFFAGKLKNREIFVTPYVLAEVTDIIENHYFKGEYYYELMEASGYFFRNICEYDVNKDTIIDTKIEKKDTIVKAGKNQNVS